MVLQWLERLLTGPKTAIMMAAIEDIARILQAFPSIFECRRQQILVLNCIGSQRLSIGRHRVDRHGAERPEKCSKVTDVISLLSPIGVLHSR